MVDISAIVYGVENKDVAMRKFLADRIKLVTEKTNPIRELPEDKVQEIVNSILDDNYIWEEFDSMIKCYIEKEVK